MIETQRQRDRVRHTEKGKKSDRVRKGVTERDRHKHREIKSDRQ